MPGNRTPFAFVKGSLITYCIRSLRLVHVVRLCLNCTACVIQLSCLGNIFNGSKFTTDTSEVKGSIKTCWMYILRYHSMASSSIYNVHSNYTKLSKHKWVIQTTISHLCLIHRYYHSSEWLWVFQHHLQHRISRSYYCPDNKWYMTFFRNT